MKVKTCCCCYSVKTGAMILGCLNLLYLAVSICLHDVIMGALRGFTALWFILMVWSDSKTRRFAFMMFYAT